MSKIHVIHENDAWVEPLRAAFAERGLPYQEWFLSEGVFDFASEPPPGVFYNRMSASSHTRGHRYAPELTAAVLAWLRSHDRRVINNARALQLELSKLDQYATLARYGIRTPHTVAAVGRDNIVEAARAFDGPFITKHNQGGKGLGIRLFSSSEQLEDYVNSEEFDAGPRGQVLLQQYIKPREPFITRVEILGGRFLYALRSDTSEGFELCPADACQLPAAAPDVCPADGAAKFSLSPLEADDPLVARYIRLCDGEGFDLAGIEFVESEDGERYTYDINGTTNYNSAVGAQAGVDGMRELARYLTQLKP